MFSADSSPVSLSATPPLQTGRNIIAYNLIGDRFSIAPFQKKSGALLALRSYRLIVGRL
jgi:hypothetical protein